MPESPEPRPFRFVTHLTLTELTGQKARDLSELLGHLKAAPLAVIYYHTHHFSNSITFSPPSRPTTSLFG